MGRTPQEPPPRGPSHAAYGRRAEDRERIDRGAYARGGADPGWEDRPAYGRRAARPPESRPPESRPPESRPPESFPPGAGPTAPDAAPHGSRPLSAPPVLAQRGVARRLASGIVLLVGGVAGVLALALPFGVGYSSGWQAFRHLAGDGGGLATAVCLLVVAAAGFVLALLGVLRLLPEVGERLGVGAVPGLITIGMALLGVAPASWVAAESGFRLGGMGIGTYAFLCSGLIGLVGALPAIVGRARRGDTAPPAAGNAPGTRNLPEWAPAQERELAPGP